MVLLIHTLVWNILQYILFRDVSIPKFWPMPIPQNVLKPVPMLIPQNVPMLTAQLMLYVITVIGFIF